MNETFDEDKQKHLKYYLLLLLLPPIIIGLVVLGLSLLYQLIA